MESFTHESLTIEPAKGENEVLSLVWLGTSRVREPSKVIGPYLNKAVEAAVERKVSLEMHFEKLEFFNSATVMALIKSVHFARSKKVKLRLVYGGDIEWQKLSFEPMRIFVKDDGLFELVPATGAAQS